MARYIHFEDKQLVIQLTGLTSFLALKRKIEIPYENIKIATVGDFYLRLIVFRIGTAFGFIQHGQFWTIKNGWYFLSTNRGSNLVILDLQGHKFKRVALQMENPEEQVAAIKARLV